MEKAARHHGAARAQIRLCPMDSDEEQGMDFKPKKVLAQPIGE